MTATANKETNKTNKKNTHTQANRIDDALIRNGNDIWIRGE